MTIEIIKKANEYRERATRYLKNFEWEMEKRDREKAGEALWGVVSCLVNALYLLEEGKPSSRHGDSCKFAQEFLISSQGEMDGKELVNAYRKVEKFHANFYHAFLDEDEFGLSAAEILQLIKHLGQLLNDKISDAEIKIK